MIRTFALGLIAAFGLSASAFATEKQSFDPAQSQAFGAELSNAATAEQARVQLAHQGYTNISELNRDETGRWVGTAMKGGKTVFVGVILPNVPHEQTN